jgi:uncharacterized protein YggU (UPF0235/DUF167 family)
VTSRLAVRVHPGARRAGLLGWMGDGALKLAVVEPPEGGRANRAVLALLADALGVPAGRLKVKGGSGGRSKWVEVEGLDRAEMLSRIERTLEQGRERDAG